MAVVEPDSGLDFRPQGDGAIRIGWPGDRADPAAVHRLQHILETAAAAGHLKGMVEIVPGYATVSVFYRPAMVAYGDLCAQLRQLAASPLPVQPTAPRTHVLPTVYGGEAGPDLPFVAEQAGLTVEEAIALHSGTAYSVAMIGFQPGFPYLTGLPEKLHTPRLARPRLQVPAGSVALGGEQTGVYPFTAPGGWRLIGRTQVTLFDPNRAEPCLCRPGDIVRFQPIPAEASHAAAR